MSQQELVSSSPMSPSRREFLRTSTAVAGAAVASQMLPKAEAQPQGKRPNIVFLYNEGHRADGLSIAGNKLLNTPNMDRIGHEGVYFNNSFCTNALCAPARTVALTGMYSHSTGALGNRTKTPLAPEIPIFTDLLHQNGYDVAMVGKVHSLNGMRERYWDFYAGFDAPNTDYYAPKFFEGRDGQMGPEKTVEGVYADDYFTDRALDWLKEKRTKPFCLNLWMQAPHAPYYRPRRYLDNYNGVPIPIPSTFNADQNNYAGKPSAFREATNKIGTSVRTDSVRSLEELVKNVYVGLMDVDDNVGRVMKYLESVGELDNTVIVLTADHGYFLGEWRFFDKRFMHEPSIRVPMMVRYPKLFSAGTKIDEMVLNLDIAPTLLELAGVPVPSNIQGKSFVNLAQKKETAWRKDWMYEYFEYPAAERVRPHRGVRTDRYKFIHYFLEPQEYEMYDLKGDPDELHNLAGVPKHAKLQATLANRLAELRKESNDTTPDQPSSGG